MTERLPNKTESFTEMYRTIIQTVSYHSTDLIDAEKEFMDIVKTLRLESRLQMLKEIDITKIIEHMPQNELVECFVENAKHYYELTDILIQKNYPQKNENVLNATLLELEKTLIGLFTHANEEGKERMIRETIDFLNDDKLQIVDLIKILHITDISVIKEALEIAIPEREKFTITIRVISDFIKEELELSEAATRQN